MSQLSATPVTALLSEHCRNIQYESLPSEATEVAKHCLLDWLGVTLAGSNEPLAAMLREDALQDGGQPQATLLGGGQRVTAKQAALINGAASHALDYDDVVLAMSGHPSVPVWPALLALAEWRGGSGQDVLAAFVAGFEMECRVGLLVMPSHYSTGFHSTGTLGTFGAAAACAHLLGFDQEQWQRTMGIAAAQAAGLKSMFGTMCKPLHAGKAAANGLFAALMAERGFTSNPEALETAQGFAATQSTAPNTERALAGLGGRYAVRDTLFKYHASCYGTHESMDGVYLIRDEDHLKPNDVERIDLLVPESHLKMCNIERPTTGLQAKFSLKFTAALAMVDRDSTEESFTDDAVARDDIASMMERVHVSAQPGDWELGTSISIRTRDGREFTRQVNLNIPADYLGDQQSYLQDKFQGLVEPVLGAKSANALIQLVDWFDEEHSVTKLVELAANTSAGVA